MRKVEYAGGWLELRDPADITVKGRRQLLAIFTSVQGPMQRLEAARDRELAKLTPAGPDGAFTDEQIRKANEASNPEPPLTEDEADRMLQLEQAGLIATIGRWSLPDPVSRATLEDMTAVAYMPIAHAAADAVQAIMTNLKVDFEPTPVVDEGPTGA
jgi:hypothetical protein